MPYTVRPVWRTPQAPATAAMIAKGALDLVRYVRRHRIEVLMPRSIIPAGMALLALRFLPDVKLLFDADGLMADERADFGGWSREGKPYRALRAIEAAAVRRADVVITRTHRAKRILAERAGLSETMQDRRGLERQGCRGLPAGHAPPSARRPGANWACRTRRRCSSTPGRWGRTTTRTGWRPSPPPCRPSDRTPTS